MHAFYTEKKNIYNVNIKSLRTPNLYQRLKKKK